MRLAALMDRARLSILAIPVIAIVASLMLFVSESAFRGVRDDLRRLEERGRARVLLMELLHRVTDAESGKRGYLLVGGQDYLVPYARAKEASTAAINEIALRLEHLDDQAAQADLGRLKEAVRGKFGEMEEVLALWDAGRRDAALDVVRSGHGRVMMDQVRERAEGMIRNQSEIIARGLSQIHRTILISRLAVGGMVALSLALLIKFMRMARDLQRQRESRQAELRAERDRLGTEVALRTAELTELARHMQTVREDEKAHLARELHDELGALLTAAKLDVARIRPRLMQELPDLKPRLDHLIETLNSGIALKRRIIEDLRPSTLSSLGLVPALEILCQEFAERSGLQVQPELESLSLSPNAQLTVYRVLQEAFTNIAKYAKARQIRVRLSAVGDEAQLLISDDGVGFDPQATRLGAHGLRGMRFRVEAENGRMTLESAPGEGTRLRVILPLCPPKEAEAASDSAPGELQG